jgi:hypothetical protein
MGRDVGQHVAVAKSHDILTKRSGLGSRTGQLRGGRSPCKGGRAPVLLVLYNQQLLQPSLQHVAVAVALLPTSLIMGFAVSVVTIDESYLINNEGTEHQVLGEGDCLFAFGVNTDIYPYRNAMASPLCYRAHQWYHVQSKQRRTDHRNCAVRRERSNSMQLTLVQLTAQGSALIPDSTD